MSESWESTEKKMRDREIKTLRKLEYFLLLWQMDLMLNMEPKPYSCRGCWVYIEIVPIILNFKMLIRTSYTT